MTAGHSAKRTYVWKLIRCACGHTFGKVKGEYEFICPKSKCHRKIAGSTMLIEWKKFAEGCFYGFVAGAKLFRISEHWTGAWLDKLDGKSIPVKCSTLQEAQEHAQGMM